MGTNAVSNGPGAASTFAAKYGGAICGCLILFILLWLSYGVIKGMMPGFRWGELKWDQPLHVLHVFFHNLWCAIEALLYKAWNAAHLIVFTLMFSYGSFSLVKFLTHQTWIGVI